MWYWKKITILGILLGCVLLPGASFAGEPDLATQYRFALEYAFSQPRYEYEEAKLWAKEYIEKKSVPAFHKTLHQNYEEAHRFALSVNGLNMESEEAEDWAKRFALSRCRDGGDKNLAGELDEFLDRAADAKEWCLRFLHDPIPYYSSSSVVERYVEVYVFLRRRLEFSYFHEEAEEAALKFVQQRYRFAPDRPLRVQYRESYEFASGILKFNFEEARNWAVSFISAKGALSGPLRDQYREAYELARSVDGLSLAHEEARTWAIAYLNAKGRFPDQPLMLQYQSAYWFAYSGDFLEILYPKPVDENLPRNVFLHDEATKWAKDLVTGRGVLWGDLQNAYQDALIFAYSNAGLGLNQEEAEEWAQKFIERPVPE